MLACSPLIASNDAGLARQILDALSSRFGDRLAACPLAECRREIAWHRRGAVVLIARSESDLDPIVKIFREHQLRRSAQQLIVVDAGYPIRARFESEWGSRVDAWREWPAEAADLVNAIEYDPASLPKDESSDLVLYDRLSALTPSLAPLARRLAVAALHDVTVLLTGETGTGKTYLAKLLHDLSPRRDERFLIIPCGAQPSELFESSFFGHVKGSFTGAHQNQPGKFACAGKGTILLDEVDTLGFEQQAALLRVIETGEYEMVGGTQTLKSEARLIVASNTNLEEAVQKGVFRQDLFYRLNVMAFELPPLRDRPSDIPLLARGFAAQYAAKYGKPIRDITDEAMQALAAFPWTGNLRQLENAIQQAVLVCRDAELTLGDLPEEVSRNEWEEEAEPTCIVDHATNGHTNGSNGHFVGSLINGRAEYERILIQRALAACHNNRSSAARALGISRVTLHKKIRLYRL